MDLLSPDAVKVPPSLARIGSSSLDRLLSRIDPGLSEEPEAMIAPPLRWDGVWLRFAAVLKTKDQIGFFRKFPPHPVL